MSRWERETVWFTDSRETQDNDNLSKYFQKPRMSYCKWFYHTKMVHVWVDWDVCPDLNMMRCIIPSSCHLLPSDYTQLNLSVKSSVSTKNKSDTHPSTLLDLISRSKTCTSPVPCFGFKWILFLNALFIQTTERASPFPVLQTGGIHCCSDLQPSCILNAVAVGTSHHFYCWFSSFPSGSVNAFLPEAARSSLWWRRTAQLVSTASFLSPVIS